MKVFISWSGELSKQLAEAFREWLPAVLQSASPYYTPSDIEKGARWSTDIAKELEASQIGVLFITRDNLHSDWILFEAGALSKTLEKSHVCPIIFGMQPTDLAGPLKQFQATTFERQDIYKLVGQINSKIAENKLSAKTLDAVFDKWWPDLEKKVADIMAASAEESNAEDRPVRSDRELIEEILTLTRERPRAGVSGISHRAVLDLLENHIRLHDDQAEEIGGYQEVLDMLEVSSKAIGHVARKFLNTSDDLDRAYKKFKALPYLTFEAMKVSEDDDEEGGGEVEI